MKVRSGPTKRAPDGWWAPRFEVDSSEELGSVSLVGSPSRSVTQAVGQPSRDFRFDKGMKCLITL